MKELLGKVFQRVEITRNEEGKSDEIIFVVSDDEKYRMYHYQDCCESVVIDDIVGDIDDLVDSPITLSEESGNSGETEWGSETWTFYKLATVKGYVDIKWWGESNGYYSEGVDVVRVGSDQDLS